MRKKTESATKYSNEIMRPPSYCIVQFEPFVSGVALLNATASTDGSLRSSSRSRRIWS